MIRELLENLREELDKSDGITVQVSYSDLAKVLDYVEGQAYNYHLIARIHDLANEIGRRANSFSGEL